MSGEGRNVGSKVKFLLEGNEGKLSDVEEHDASEPEEPQRKKKKTNDFVEKEAEEEDNGREKPFSDDDEEDEEGLDEYEKDGFIVDDDEEEMEEEDEEGNEKKKKKKKKKKKAERPLDVEDLELIKEASGISFPIPENRKKFKRIKKKTQEETQDTYSLIKNKLFDEEVGEEEEEEDENEIQEDIEESDIDEEDDLEGFIVEGVDEFGEPIPTKKKKKRNRDHYWKDITSSQLDEARDIFGDTSFFEQEEEEEEMLRERVTSKLEDHYDTEELRLKYISKDDEIIRTTDVPERHQLRFPNRPPPEDNELKLEAEWIYTRAYVQTEEKPLHTIVPKIVHVLEYLRKEHLEVPYIATYKKDYYHPELNHQDLWKIYDLDDKWSHLYSRKKALRKLYTRVNADEDLIKLLDESTSETDVQDLFDHFMMHYIEEIPIYSKYKRASKRDIYKQCKKEGVLEFTKCFGLTPKEFGENMMENHLRHAPVDHPRAPEDMAVEYISNQFASIDLVLTAARYCIAKEIAFDPRVRASVRQIYEEKATISTFPTLKGRKEIDTFHPFRIIMRIDNKPLHEFKKPDEEGCQFLLILKAFKEGFIKFKIGMPDELFINEMENLFISEGYSIEAQAWNEQRKLILKEAVTRHLYPLLEKEVKAKLIEEARECVMEMCSKKLERKLLVAPYKPEKANEDDEEEEFSVMACCWGSGNIATMCAVLDKKGEYVDHLKLDFLDESKLTQFVKTHNPSVIVIGAQLEAKRLFESLRRIAESNLEMTKVIYVSLDVATVFSNSPRSSSEFPNFPQILKQAISLGRYFKDQLMEIAGLCNESKEILCLNLHFLQNMIPKEHLEKHLHRSIINVVKTVGVDVNKAIQYPFLSYTLQFVAGLGPRKALGIINKANRRGFFMNSREDLESLLGPVVFHNCAGFIKIPDGEEPLDSTRIHPDDYSLVKKMAKDALEDTVQRKKIDDDTALIETLMENPHKLEDLDLDAFADELEKKLKEKKRSILFKIKEEIEIPFGEKRSPYKEPTPEELFEIMTGEPPGSIPIGQLVYCRISRVFDKFAFCQLDSGLPGTILVQDISDTHFDTLRELQVEVGTTLACRIKGVNVPGLTLNLTCKSSDLQSPRWEEEMLEKFKLREHYLVIEPLQQDEQPVIKKTPKKKIISRQINHPLFKNVSFQEAEELLSDEPVGEVIIRPSSRGIDYLTITWKFHEDTFVHITVKEEDKINPSSLGKTLWIGYEQFEDLDEILARYIEPMNNFQQQMTSYRKFRDISKSEMDEALKQEKEANSSSIPYFVSISHEIPGKFVLGFMPSLSKPPKHEYISVTPEGFRFRKQMFHSPEELIGWFKRNWKNSLHQEKHSNMLTTQEIPSIPPEKYDPSWTGGWDQQAQWNQDQSFREDSRRDSRHDKRPYSRRHYRY